MILLSPKQTHNGLTSHEQDAQNQASVKLGLKPSGSNLQFRFKKRKQGCTSQLGSEHKDGAFQRHRRLVTNPFFSSSSFALRSTIKNLKN